MFFLCILRSVYGASLDNICLVEMLRMVRYGKTCCLVCCLVKKGGDSVFVQLDSMDLKD